MGAAQRRRLIVLEAVLQVVDPLTDAVNLALSEDDAHAPPE